MIELSGQKIAFYRQLPDHAMQIIDTMALVFAGAITTGK
ncbi:hypothetical protein SAMN05421754_10627 [Nitrosomonas sp. Nm58]|jgi:hypothetical protein|nr:hypothetical protein SAMN05421754_10627 [Nitrosomonas sp. Nm58]